MLIADVRERFVIQGVAGAGGMGTVYRALDRTTGARVALKVVAPEGAALAARFAMEAEALRALDHPGVVRLVAHGRGPDGQPFLATEWIDGKDLAATLDRGRLTPRQVAELGARVAGALAAAHARGIVHRDIKPQNLLLPGGQLDRVKVIDFGLARLGSARWLTPNGTLLGTPGYMAPEQASGSGDVDARADLFSLGAVLFECLTGRPAFAGEHPMAVLAKLLIEEPPRVSALCPDVPAALADLIDLMLAKDPAGRPQAADEVMAALESIAATIDSGDDAPHAASRRPGRRSLTGSEQRLVSVVVVRPGPGSTAAAETPGAPHSGWRRAPALFQALRDGLVPLGARADPLLDGSLLLTWMSAEAPADQAARAARGALLARRLDHRASIALASGLSDTSQPLPVGQVLDRAASLLCSSGAELEVGVRIDTVVAGLLDARFQVAWRGGGVELLGEDDIGQGARMLLGRPTPFVGRDRELRALTDLLDECVREGVARAVLITAPAGGGKSRLRHELLQALGQRPRSVDVWQARGDLMTAGAAFALLGSSILRTANVPNGAPLRARQAALRARVAQHVPAPDCERVTAFLGEMIGTPFPDEHHPLLQSARQSAVAMVEQIRRAWTDFIAAECAAHPVLLVLEDMHWGDTSSVALLDATLGELRARPLLVLGLGRPEVHDVFPRLWARHGVQQIALTGLTRRAAEELVRHVLGQAIDDRRLAQLLDQADGNAFYLEEMIRSVAEGHEGRMPETVLAMVQARLDALTSDQRSALRAASVFGRSFWPGGVAALLGDREPLDLLDASLDALVHLEILVRRAQSRFPDEHELSFRHELLRDGAYALLTESDRSLGHSLAAEWLEHKGESDAPMLAEHFERGKQPERAASYRLVTAERALAGSDMQTAIATAERIAPPDADVSLRLRRARVLVEAYWFTGDLERADAQADEILALAPARGEFWSGLDIKIMLAAELGSPERLSSAILALMGAPVTEENAPELVRSHSMLVVVFAMTGPRELAAHHLDCAERLAAAAALDPTTQWLLHTARGQWRFVFESDYGAALRAFQDALAWSERTGDSRWGAFSHALLGWIYNVLGDFERSEEAVRRAIAASHRTGQAGLIGRVVLSWTHAMRGRTEEARLEAERAIENARGNGYGEGMGRTALGHVLMVGGHHDAASREVEAAVDALETTPLLRTIALATAAEVRLAQGRAREALSLAREALGREGQVHIYPSSEFCARLTEILALAALGDPHGARAALVRARERLAAQADRIEDEALRASFLRKPPWNDRISALGAGWPEAAPSASCGA